MGDDHTTRAPGAPPENKKPCTSEPRKQLPRHAEQPHTTYLPLEPWPMVSITTYRSKTLTFDGLGMVTSCRHGDYFSTGRALGRRSSPSAASRSLPTLFAATGCNSTHDGDWHRGSRGQLAVEAQLPQHGDAVEPPARPGHRARRPARSRSPHTQRQVAKTEGRSRLAGTTGRMRTAPQQTRAHRHCARFDRPTTQPPLQTRRPRDGPRRPRSSRPGRRPRREQGSHRRATTPLPCTSAGPPRTGATHRPSSHWGGLAQ